MIINQGDIFWIQPEESNEIKSDFTHPHVVIQDNTNTLIVCALTSNMKQAKTLGNILLEVGEANLPKQSVVVASKVFTVKKSQLGEYIGSLSKQRINQIIAGMEFIQIMIGVSSRFV